MPWHLVVISKRCVDDTSAKSFIEAFANGDLIKLTAGDDHDIRVYHRSDAETDCLWLSPAAAASAAQLLALFGSTPCPQEPALSGFEKIEFPFKLG